MFVVCVHAPLHIIFLERASEGWRKQGRVGESQGGIEKAKEGWRVQEYVKGGGGVIKTQGVLERARKSWREPGSVGVCCRWSGGKSVCCKGPGSV